LRRCTLTEMRSEHQRRRDSTLLSRLSEFGGAGDRQGEHRHRANDT
jgi:hypothetical protein